MSVPDVGYLATLLALALVIYGLLALALGLRWSLPDLLASGRNAALGTAALLTVAALALLYAFLSRDFSVRYVAENASRDMPLLVTATAFWGGQAGSLLFWAWMLALFTALFVLTDLPRTPRLGLPALLVLLLIQTFFLGLLGFVSSPFERLPQPVSDGRGLNPLLWDEGMRVHPPLLLTGYMSFSLPFALTMGALLRGSLGADWLRLVRKWMLIAWAVQSAGLLAGAWWAYHVLGWGGYWGWDPVENAALLPWLTATAFLHSIMVQERRGMLRVWNVGLAIATFGLALFGTFVVRSGVLSSVHSFAQSLIGPYFFAFLGVSLIAALALLVYRLPVLTSQGTFDAVLARESAFLLNNLLFTASAAVTFWGTIFPLLSEIVRGVKITVGPPFYQQVNGPLFLGIVLLMGVGPLLAWRRTALPTLWRLVRGPLLAAVLAGGFLWAVGMRTGLAVLALMVCVFTAATILWEYHQAVRVRRRAGQPWLRALALVFAQNRRRYGGYLVHLGVVLLAVGVVVSSFFQAETALTLQRGETFQIGPYRLTYQGLEPRIEPGVAIVAARLTVEGDLLGPVVLTPERRVHRNWEQQPVTTVAYRTLLPRLDDLYILLVNWQEGGQATFRVFLNPLVTLLWVGGLLLLLGTLVALWPERAGPVRRPVAVPREVVPSEV